jgi:hypothetical protein
MPIDNTATPMCSTCCREGLNARAHLFGGSDQIQISVDPGQKFDYEAQLQDLRGDVLKIKHVSGRAGSSRVRWVGTGQGGAACSVLAVASRSAPILLTQCMSCLCGPANCRLHHSCPCVLYLRLGTFLHNGHLPMQS